MTPTEKLIQQIRDSLADDAWKAREIAKIEGGVFMDSRAGTKLQMKYVPEPEDGAVITVRKFNDVRRAWPGRGWLRGEVEIKSLNHSSGFFHAMLDGPEKSCTLLGHEPVEYRRERPAEKINA